MHSNRREFFKSAVLGTTLSTIQMPGRSVFGRTAVHENLEFNVDLSVIRRGWDGVKCYVHSRAGSIPPRTPANPGNRPIVVLTTQKHAVHGNDIFDALEQMRSDDEGETWSGPSASSGLVRRKNYEGIESVPCDFTPKWHSKSGVLLGTGKTFSYRNDNQYEGSPAQAIYSTYNPSENVWANWKAVGFPQDPRFHHACAGCSQRFDLPNGDILLPIYFQPEPGNWDLRTTVVYCTFDGQILRYVRHGNEFELPEKPSHHDGLSEPSLTKFDDRYYLTLRSIVRGYVTVSQNGESFAPLKPWCFDDGQELGNYQTQQHWVTHSEGLYLVYTRRGANNDHIFRHRAPLFMACIDPKKLVVIRETERIIVPQSGTRLGNFGVVDVSCDETWIITTEWMQHPPPGGFEKYGSDNRCFLAKIRWNRPNRLLR